MRPEPPRSSGSRELFFRDVSATVAHLIALEMGDLTNRVRGIGMVAGVRHRALVTMLGMEVIVHVSPKIGRPVKPGTRTDKYATCEPLWSIVPVGRASVRRNVIVSIGAIGRGTDANGDLRAGLGSTYREQSPRHKDSRDRGKRNAFETIHYCPLTVRSRGVPRCFPSETLICVQAR